MTAAPVTSSETEVSSSALRSRTWLYAWTRWRCTTRSKRTSGAAAKKAMRASRQS